ncbi:NAD-dependent epimerase/dehydratase family protein [Mariniphaga sediminis]|uniref:NAD-dependent epimerase/dehydratase family protein n=1 Tax=Mariniphaga sediminis TaxID=1628158 RepID=A0A399CU77_9BACT|nr:NAD-dependent epimerase/dehydratase family protein [Mariniphaga sediminis]RIH62893.1 NAD-dependent epimerase/dehydratase family protein [Mariniphaga sediminis]
MELTLNNKKPFEELTCELFYADILYKASLKQAFKGVNKLYHVAAVFKHWSRNPGKDILEANLKGTQNVLEAAAECGIEKIIYVSSIAALDFNKLPMNEKSWGTVFPNTYFKAKNDSEKLAWHLAYKLSLNMITVLPSGMIGPEIFANMALAMNMLNNMVKNRLAFDPQYEINYVHVKDVAKGMILAEQNGRIGERYILGSEYSLNTSNVIQIARNMYADIQVPKKANKRFQLFLAQIMKITSIFTGKPPLLLKGNIHHYYKKEEHLDIEKARRELGYNPRKPEIALKETIKYLYEKKTKE